MSEVLYLHQIFIDLDLQRSNQYTHFDMLICQKYLQVTEGSLDYLGSLAISRFDMLFFIKLSQILWKFDKNDFNV